MATSYQQSGRFCFVWDSASDVGRVRENNEDALIEAPGIGLLGVCDGLGGHAAGEVASALASATIVELLKGTSASPREALLEGITTANEKILQEQVADPKLRGMGTTLSAVWIVPRDSEEIWIAHIGDSRVYLLRDGKLKQVTEDHSPVFRLHKQGFLTKDQILEHPQKNLLDRSLGIMTSTDPDVFQLDLQAGDIVLVCTDGLTDTMRDREIEEILTSTPVEELGQRLVASANAKGGYDNITLAFFKIVEIQPESSYEDLMVTNT